MFKIAVKYEKPGPNPPMGGGDALKSLFDVSFRFPLTFTVSAEAPEAARVITLPPTVSPSMPTAWVLRSVRADLLIRTISSPSASLSNTLLLVALAWTPVVEEIALIFCTASLTSLAVTVKEAVSVPLILSLAVFAVEAVAVSKMAYVAAEATT